MHDHELSEAEAAERVRRLFAPADPQFATWELIALMAFTPLAYWFVGEIAKPADGMLAIGLFTSFCALFMLGMLKGVVIVTGWIAAIVRRFIAVVSR